MSPRYKPAGFTILEVLVVMAVIAILSSIALASLNTARVKARDAARKMEVSQIGRLLTSGCPMPSEGVGDYDLAELAASLALQYPQYAQFVQNLPNDPGSEEGEVGYRYVVNASGKCALYANLERSAEPATLSITAPTPGGGTGVLEAAVPGINGTNKYFQVSN